MLPLHLKDATSKTLPTALLGKESSKLPSYLIHLLCCSKFLEDIRKYINVKFALNERSRLRHSGSPYVKSTKIIGESMMIFYLRPKKVFLNKPITVGYSILELSKLFVAKSYYEVFQPRWPRLKVVLSDTGKANLYHHLLFTLLL